MYKKEIFKFVSMLSLLSAVFLISQIATPVFASEANYALEIIQPREKLNTTNRYYKAYPGLEYNVRLAVIGGVYPFYYKLTTAPVGMTIDSFTGEINWDNPTESGSPHTVVVKVTDAEEAEDTVEWTVNVTTSGFRFLDAVNGKTAGNGGDGSIKNPWKELEDFYTSSKWNSDYEDEFLYFKTGTYATEGMADLESGPRLAFISDKKPRVWLAYPGESPLIDVEGGPMTFYGSATNVYFDGFEFQSSTTNNQLLITGAANNLVVRNCLFDGNNLPGTGSNTSLLFSTNYGVGGHYWAIQDNMFKDINGYAYLIYHGTKVVVENNATDGTLDGFSPKHNNNMFFIRGNYITNVSNYGIYIMEYGDSSADIEVSYNFVEAAVQIRPSQPGGPIYFLRNTLVGSVDIRDSYVDHTNGPFYFDDNIIINNSSGNKISYSNTSYPEKLVVNDSLLGTVSDNIVDEYGLLTKSYEAYIGSRGWQLGSPDAHGTPFIGPIGYIETSDGGSSANDEPVDGDEPLTGLLFEESFEDGNFSQRGWYDNISPVLSSSETTPGSTRSLELHFPSGATKPTSGGAMRKQFDEAESVYISYNVKYSDNWLGSNRNYHPHEFNLLTNKDGDWAGPAYTHLTAYVEQNQLHPRLAIQDGKNIDLNNIDQNLVGETEIRGVAGCNGTIDDGGTDSCYAAGGGLYNNGKNWAANSPLITVGKWHKVEAHFKLNSISNGIGVADGILQYRLNGELIINQSNVIFRTGEHSDMKFKQFIISPFIGDGSPVDQTFWVDNLKVATAMPDMPDSTNGLGVPTNLRVISSTQ